MVKMIKLRSFLGLCLLTIFLSVVSCKLADSACRDSLWKNGKITNSMLKSSSHQTTLKNSGLDCCSGSISGGWCGDKRTSNNWLEVDFPQVIGIRGVVIQTPEDVNKGYVKSVQLEIQQRNMNSLVQIGQSISTNFTSASQNKLTISFAKGYMLNKLRIKIIDYEKEPCMRFDVIGCTSGDLCPDGCLNGGTCLNADRCDCTAGYTGDRCEVKEGGCNAPLGMRDGSIPKEMLSVSSFQRGKEKEKARYGCCEGQHVGAWCPDPNDNNPWYQVVLPRQRVIHTISFQHPGRESNTVLPDTYMKNFRLEFISPLDPEKNWRTFSGGIPAIYNNTVHYDISLIPSIVTDKIRIFPETFEKAPCFRFELLGCDPSVLCPADWCQNGGKCVGEKLCECTKGFSGDQCETSVTKMTNYIIHFQKITQTTITTTTSIIFQIHGNVRLETENQKQVLHLSGSNSYTTISNSNFTSCLVNIDGCTSGFTVSLNANFLKITDNTFIISSGGNIPGTKGFALYYRNKKLYCSVTTSSQIWTLQVPFVLNTNVWKNFEFSWSKTLGLELYIDHMFKGSVTRPAPTTAMTTKQIALGYGHLSQSVSIDMKIEGLKTYDLSRSQLVREGIVTKQPTTVAANTTPQTITTTPALTSTMKPVPTTSTGIKLFNFTFIGINGNILYTPTFNFTVYGNPKLRPEPDGSAILVLNTHGQYVELPNKGLECVENINTCDKGFTFQVEVKILEYSVLNKTYIFSSGGDKLNSSGVALFLWNGELYCSTKRDNIIWAAKKNVTFNVTVWHKYQVSWNKKAGFIVFVDGVHFMTSVVRYPTAAQPNTHELLIANAFNATTTTKMEIKNLFTWTASRDILITEGVITEYPTTRAPLTTVSTASLLKTTTPYQSNGFKILDFTFIKIVSKTLVTPSMNFTIFGNPLLIPDNHGNYVLVINKTGEYLELPNNGLECLIDISKCQKGFTLRADIKFLVQTVGKSRLYIFSSGGDQAGTTGIALFVDQSSKLCSVARSRDRLWSTCKTYTFELTQWHTYQISWNPSEGFYVFVDGKPFMRPELNLQLQIQTGIHPLLIGGSFSTNITTYMTIKNLYTWTASRDILIQQGVIEEYTTPPPTVATTEYVKQTTCGKYPADIVFVIDESSSIGNRNFGTVKTFVKNLIKDLMTDSGKYVQIGLLTFASRSTNQFWLNQYSSANEMFDAIDRIKYGKRGTDIADGLKFARENSFSKTHGARDGASKILVLFTDGYSKDTDSEAQKLHAAGITAMVIGVTKDVNEQQLAKIASKPTYLKHVDNFDGLDAIKEGFLKEIPCEEEIPKYEWNLISSTISQTTIIGSQFNLTIQGGAQMNASHGLELTSSNQFIDFGIHQNLCVGNLSLCYHGITIQITVMFMKLEENTVIMTSGGDRTDGTGIALVYRYGKVQCVVSNSTVSWYATISRETLSLFHIHTILISWSNVHGLKIIVDNHVIQHTTTSVEHHEIKNKPEHMCIGSSTSSSTQIDYFVKTVTIWQVWIGIIIDVGEIAPPVDETTTTVATTKAAPATTEYCKMGWVCKDKITTITTMQPTTSKKLTTTRKPTTKKPITTTRQPTTTKKPTTTTRQTTTTKPKPVKPTTPNKPHITPGVDSHGSAYIQCKFVKAVQQNVEYFVYLNIDGVRVLTKKVSGKYETVQFTITEINDNLNNKKITCSLQAYFIGQTILTTEVISGVFIPKIQLISHGKIILIEGHPPKPIQVSMTGPPQMFCCKGCKGYCQVHIITHANFDRHYTRCHNDFIPQVLVGWAGEKQSGKPDTCGTTVRPLSWNTTIEIPITANADMLYDRDHNGQFTVQAKIIDVPQPVQPGFVATPHTLDIGKIQVQAKNNDHKSTCVSINDPHITTFDRKRYDNFIEGEFTLYRHKTLPFEVRAKYSKCSSGRQGHGHGHGHGRSSRATCNCAVAIKSGDDVITFTGCARNAEYWQRHFHRHPPITVEMYKNGELTPGTLVRRIGCGQKYEVRLPTGTFITIQQSFLSFINIWIRPSSLDYGKTEGLCGMYDRNPNNDVIDGNGRPVPGRNPDKFSLMWRARLTLFGGVQASALTGITTFCSCVDTRATYCLGSYGSMQCWDPRYDITKTLIKQAKVPQHGRHKRQAASTNNDVVDTNQDNTTYVMNHTEAYNKCEEFITNNGAAKSCNKYLQALSNETTNNTERIENCALDLMLTGDEEWTRDHVRDIVEECLSESERRPAPVNATSNDTVLPTENPLTNSLENMCLEDCGKYGSCKQGVCDCNAGYSGEYCNISSSTKPSLATVPIDGMGCDMRVSDDCTQAVIYGNNFVESEDITCHFQYIQVDQDVKTIRSPGTVDAIYVSITQVICPLPDIKDTNGAFIRVSNDKTEPSDEAFIHLIYDSMCFDCEIKNKTDSSHCERRPNTCIINGQCFAANSKKADNECKVCDPSNADDRWTDSDATKCISKPMQVAGDEETEKRNKTIIMILGIVCGVLGFFLLFSLVCICKLRSKYQTKEFGEYNMSKSPYVSLHRTEIQKSAMDNPTYDEQM